MRLALGHIQRIQTADGSWTLIDRDRDLTYRSIHGATAESEYVFVDPSGIDAARAPATWRVLELGFGGATNFHRTALRAAELGLDLQYTAVEHSPVDPSTLVHDDATDSLIRSALHASPAPAQNEYGTLRLYICDWRDCAPDNRFDVVYHDPFDPHANPDAWSEDCFRWSRELVEPGARLLTYSVAGHVRRAMESVGWRPEKRPGLARKREVLLAVAE